LGTSDTSGFSKVNYGYLMEKVVLKATDMRLATCWIGYFDKDYFPEVIVEKEKEIPGIVILGFSERNRPTLEKIVRFSLKASKRNEWKQLFFNYKSDLPLSHKQVKGYADSLDMVRLAPSSGNTQPWRVFFDESAAEFHFFKKAVNKNYEKTGMHYIDLGIALSHFEMTAVQNKLSGSWKIYPNDQITSPAELEYIITWKCNKKTTAAL